MNEQTLKLLEKAVLASPGDWETRAHLIDEYLAAGQGQRAAQLLQAAPEIPDTEADALRKAKVELATDPSAAQITLERILAGNKACAEAYLLLAKIFQKRGLREEARKNTARPPSSTKRCTMRNWRAGWAPATYRLRLRNPLQPRLKTKRATSPWQF